MKLTSHEKVTLVEPFVAPCRHTDLLVHCSQISIVLMLEEGTLTPAGDFSHLDFWPVLVSIFFNCGLATQ